MGVRGLTTYIRSNSHKYLKDHELHDTYVVIDGNSITAQLYNTYTVCNDAFGGDYDKLSKCIEKFFDLLTECNVTPLVVLDGGYEDKKLKTVKERMRNRVKTNKRINSIIQTGLKIFPLLMRDTFLNCLKRLGIQTVRCDFEADYETACIARNLNCPVISYDSDYFIFDVLYVPFPDIEMCVTTVTRDDGTIYNCVCCKIFYMSTFLQSFGGLKKENIPLLATVLGNDYISRASFMNFFTQIKRGKRRASGKERSRQIVTVIQWLQNETFQSAVRKILGRLSAGRRSAVAKQIETITNGYVCKYSEMFKYFTIDVGIENSGENPKVTIDLDTINSDITDDVDDFDSDESDKSEEAVIEKKHQGDEEDVDSSDSDSDDTLKSVDVQMKMNKSQQTITLSNWFKYKYRTCVLPQCFMDIIFRNTYFCVPQIENYTNVHSHFICEPIFQSIHKILTSGQSAEGLRYLARDRSKIKRYQIPVGELDLPKLNDLKDFETEASTDVLLRILNLKSVDLKEFNSLPDDWKLYFLALAYWVHHADEPKVSKCNIYSIIFCLFVMQIVDKRIGFHRCKDIFVKKFNKTINNAANNVATDSKQEEREIVDRLNFLNERQCILLMHEMIGNFQMDPKLKTCTKSFTIEIVDAFAQFQSCLMHVNYLNTLLNFPYREIYIQDFYNGSFLYNLCYNFSRRVNLDAYIDTFLQNHKSVYMLFDNIKRIVLNMCDDNVHASTMKTKRKRKKRKNKGIVKYEHELMSEEDVIVEEEEIFFDANNRFSNLRMK